MSSVIPTASSHDVGGQMSGGEARFCEAVRQLGCAVIEGRTPFSTAMTNLALDLRELRKNGFDADAALSSGWRPAIDAVSAISSPRVCPSEAERAFVADMDGLIDFAMRNGVSFLSVLSALAHDVGELASHDWSLEKLKDDFIRPHVTGWAEKNKAPMGDPDAETG